MPDSYYPKMQDSPPDAPPAGDTPPDKAESESVLLPKSILGGKQFKVGDEIVLKIVHEYEDEIEVEYAKDKPDKEDKEENLEAGEVTKGGDMTDMAQADEKLSSMAGGGY